MPDLSAAPSDNRYFAFRDHPLRAALSSEMHGRKLPEIVAPARAMQIIFASRDEDSGTELDCLRKLIARDEPVNANSRYKRVRLDKDGHLVWERHTEFSSYMFIQQGRQGSSFDAEDFSFLPRSWIAELPGQVVRATQIAILDKPQDEIVKRHFSQEDLVHCGVLDGRAEIWSDFRLHDDGFGRLLLVSTGATPSELALTVQRLQELGNYRNLCLLGLPVAQKMSPQLLALERDLSVAAAKIASGDVPDEILLANLCDISARIAKITAETDYRMSASRAYSEMVDDRLKALRIVRKSGYQTLGDFTERRLHPAVRTCMSFSSRLDALAQRSAWTSSLQRTRVDTELSTQNRDLLASMNRRTALQLRLQSTVEGLSVVAISYYMTGLVGYVAKAVTFGGEPGHARFMAVSVPLIVATVWLALRHIRGRLESP